MALMTDIRENLGKAFLVLITIFFLLLIFLEWGMDLTGRKGGRTGTTDVVGVINGREISYKQFADVVRRSVENQKKQSGQEVDEETERQVRSQVWNQLVEEALIEQEIDRLNITVSDQEIVDIVRGPNPPEMLVSQFKDSTGTFRRDAYDQAMSDPQNRDAWLQEEDMLRTEQRRKKLQSLLMASVRVSEGEVRERFIERNVSMDADFVLFDVNRMVPDSAVTVTDDDARKYYNSHPEEFKVKAGRKVQYVTFSSLASHEDSVGVREEMQRLLDQAKSGLDFAELASTYSETPQSDAYFKHGELGREKEIPLFAAKKGEIVGPVAESDGLHLFKILDDRQGKDEFVKASHIILSHTPGPDSVKVIKKIRDIARRARAGEDFAKLARENGQDGTAPNGGELGWNGKGAWVKPFEEAAFRGRVGEFVGPVRTQFGWHVIHITGKDKREIKVSRISMKIKASTKTTDGAAQRAQDFSFLANDEGFEKAGQNSQLHFQESPEFTKGAVVPGLGINDAVNNFAFKGAVGTVSEPISIANGVGVFRVSGIREEGVRPFEDVKTVARAGALKQKKMDRLRPRAEEFRASLTSASDFLAEGRKVSGVFAQKTTFKLAEVPPGIGREPKFNGTAMALKPGEISSVVEGLRGFYVIKLNAKSEIDTVRYAVERVSLRDQLLNDKRSRFLNDWRTALRESATIEDHRDKFYR